MLAGLPTKSGHDIDQFECFVGIMVAIMNELVLDSQLPVIK